MKNKSGQISLKERYGNIGDVEEFIEDGNFINGEDYLTFLTQYGYKVDGYYDGNKKSSVTFKCFDGSVQWLDGALILLQNEKGFKEISAEEIENNPFVKQISMSLTEFKIKTISKYKRWGKVEKDNVYAYVTKGNVEKDLSIQWIKFLAGRYFEYEQYMINRYRWVKINAMARKEDAERLIARRVGEIDNNLIEIFEEQENIIEESDHIIGILKNGK